MPMLVRTPEDIFREEKKDIYLIRNRDRKHKRHFPDESPGIQMIRQWIKDNLPGTKVELLGPSEHSGIIEGGIDGSIRVDFSPEGLQQFCARWEVNDKSVDKRFQCYILPYQRWFEKHGCFVPTLERPRFVGLCRWVHTPLGFLSHQLDAAEGKKLDVKCHPANKRDVWVHATNLWPELAPLQLDQLCYGHTVLDETGAVEYAVYIPPFDPLLGYTPPTEAQMRDWFGWPENLEIIEGDGW